MGLFANVPNNNVVNSVTTNIAFASILNWIVVCKLRYQSYSNSIISQFLLYRILSDTFWVLGTDRTCLVCSFSQNPLADSLLWFHFLFLSFLRRVVWIASDILFSKLTPTSVQIYGSEHKDFNRLNCTIFYFRYFLLKFISKRLINFQ